MQERRSTPKRSEPTGHGPAEGFVRCLTAPGRFLVAPVAIGRTLLAVFAVGSTLHAAQPDPTGEPLQPSVVLTEVSDLTAGDMPYDNGSRMYLSWSRMSFDGAPGAEYVVERAEGQDGPFEEVLRFAADTRYKTDVKGPWWAWPKGAPENSPHFVPLPTPVRKRVSVPLEGLPSNLAIPESLAPVLQYNALGAVLTANSTLSEEQRAMLLSLSEDRNFRTAARKLIRKARTFQNGGQLQQPLTNVPYYFRVHVVQQDRQGPLSAVVSAAARENWFNLPLLNNLLFIVFMVAVLLIFLEIAKRRELFLRQIPGLDAVEEAIGRATEMGKSVFYLTGLFEMDKISTIAATIILGEVAKKTAAYGVDLKVPHIRSVTMAVCREITRNAYTEAGRPDAYHDDINYYITDEQFSYAAAVNGQMLRERPGAVFYTGYYFAESLLMAEAGATTGAIQIAATDSESQLPFFITTCDYTLIGEELYAASAYLSRKPELVGSLRAQDVGKLLIMLLIVLGTLLVTLSPFRGFSSQWVLDVLGTY